MSIRPARTVAAGPPPGQRPGRRLLATAVSTVIALSLLPGSAALAADGSVATPGDSASHNSISCIEDHASLSLSYSITRSTFPTATEQGGVSGNLDLLCGGVEPYQGLSSFTMSAAYEGVTSYVLCPAADAPGKRYEQEHLISAYGHLATLDLWMDWTLVGDTFQITGTANAPDGSTGTVSGTASVPDNALGGYKCNLTGGDQELSDVVLNVTY